MSADPSRREHLTRLAADYVYEHGLIGLSLRPLARAIDTSDRMLIYHFGDKDTLVANVLRLSNDLAVAQVNALPDSTNTRDAVIGLWAALTQEHLVRSERVYVEAAALGLLGREPYWSVVRAANERWRAALTRHITRAGCPAERAERVMWLMDAAFMGFILDMPMDSGDPRLSRAVEDLADALAAIAAS